MKNCPPFIPFTLLFIAGILADGLFDAGLIWPIAFVAVGLALIHFRAESILFLALGFGMLISHVHRVATSPHDIRNIFGERPAYVEFVGRVTDDPIPRARAHEDRIDFPISVES